MQSVCQCGAIRGIVVHGGAVWRLTMAVTRISLMGVLGGHLFNRDDRLYYALFLAAVFSRSFFHSLWCLLFLKDETFGVFSSSVFP